MMTCAGVDNIRHQMGPLRMLQTLILTYNSRSNIPYLNISETVRASDKTHVNIYRFWYYRMASLRMLYSATLTHFPGQTFKTLISRNGESLRKKRSVTFIKTDIRRRMATTNVVLCDLVLHFQGQPYETLISWKR